MDKNKLTALGKSAEVNKGLYNFDRPDPAILECFANPADSAQINPSTAPLTIHIEVPEFTCLCPVTGQPDFATIVIDYQPDRLCVESKSLKLYMMGYRNFGGFHEENVTRICNDLVALLAPLSLRVEGRFTPRGGIILRPVSEYKRDR